MIHATKAKVPHIVNDASHYSDGQIDLMATAFWCGMTEHALLRRFAARRAETARSAYALFMLGSVFLCLWIWEAMHMPFRVSRIISAIEFLPFCAVFCNYPGTGAGSSGTPRSLLIKLLAPWDRVSRTFQPRFLAVPITDRIVAKS
jgi:hypothetical protein